MTLPAKCKTPWYSPLEKLCTLICKMNSKDLYSCKIPWVPTDPWCVANFCSFILHGSQLSQNILQWFIFVCETLWVIQVVKTYAIWAKVCSVIETVWFNTHSLQVRCKICGKIKNMVNDSFNLGIKLLGPVPVKAQKRLCYERIIIKNEYKQIPGLCWI